MSSKPDIFTVSRLNQEVRALIETGLGSIWVEAEISNLAMPASGHWYFSLKDSRAQVRCAMFRGNNSRLSFKPKDGDQVLVKARVSIYEPRGDYQLIAEQMEPAGDGALRRAFEQLKKKLQTEGLFAEEHKQEFPELPSCVGVVTSSTGAAIHDILTVLKRRFPAIPVIIYPCMVQGDPAAGNIASMIELANERQECDVLIVARGGGSLEDLWSFNEEVVARAIFDSEIPIVSGVGHEVDVTIADFVADHRAPTPSAAAEFVSPDISEWRNYLVSMQEDLVGSIQQLLQTKLQQIKLLQSRLQRPDHRLQQHMQRLDFLTSTLIKTTLNKIKNNRQQLAGLARTLDAYSPLATLDRGYSITMKDKQVIQSVKQAKAGDVITTSLSDGEITSTVT